MDWLAKNLMAAIRDSMDSVNETYLESKADEYSKLDRLGAMREISGLDAVAREALATRLRVEPFDIESFVRVMKRL